MTDTGARLSPALLNLVDEARAEAKRAGLPGPDVKALALALARRDGDAFDQCFGEGAADALVEHASATLETGGEPEMLALLASCESADASGVLLALRDQTGLAEHLATVVDEAEAVQEAAVPAIVDGFVHVVPPDPAATGREDVVQEILALVSRRVPATPLVSGPPGSGRTALLGALAARLDGEETGPLAGVRVARLGVDLLFGDNPMSALDSVLDHLKDGWIVAIDDAEAALSLGTRGFAGMLLLRLRAAIEDPASRVLLMMDDHYASRLDATEQELFAELTPVALEPLSGDALIAVVDQAAAQLSEHHGVTLDLGVARLAAAPPGRLDRRAHPGLLFDRLDGACSRARMREDRVVTSRDLEHEVSIDVRPPDPTALANALRRRVKGQDQALEAVCRRLALTRARLDLRPDRPDGVFLFVGPTGVGKTEVARALCAEVMGDESALIRLDMSEYAHDWAVSRLVGPMPGYVGSTEPETWLTTRIVRQPSTVLLLDEIEKAHPIVWNTFLQVFDAGRLSDSRGVVADFSRTVIVMTSNLGADAFADRSNVGFVDVAETDAERGTREASEVVAAVRERMAPELVNRLDDVVVFQPLTEESIHEIAHAELERLAARLAERGYSVSYGEGVAELLAKKGHDRRYGARNLQRAIEQLLLQPLVGVEPGVVVAELEGDAIVWRPSG